MLQAKKVMHSNYNLNFHSSLWWIFITKGRPLHSLAEWQPKVSWFVPKSKLCTDEATPCTVTSSCSAKRILPLFYLAVPLIFIADHLWLVAGWIRSHTIFALYTMAFLKNYLGWEQLLSIGLFPLFSGTKCLFSSKHRDIKKTCSSTFGLWL